jgi:phage tail-like protein
VRGAIQDLASPHPLANQLPVVYLEHDFLGRFLAALDEVLAPALLVLDNLAAHLNPATAPPDLLDWLASWVAAPSTGGGPEQPLRRRRELVASAVGRHRRRGTAAGLADVIGQELGVRPQVEETGTTLWSADPGEGVPPTPERAHVTVRVQGPVDRDALARLVAAEVPAHISFDIEVLP